MSRTPHPRKRGAYVPAGEVRRLVEATERLLELDELQMNDEDAFVNTGELDAAIKRARRRVVEMRSRFVGSK